MNVFPSGMASSLGSPYSEFGEFWLGEGVYDWDVLRAQIDLFVENAPDAYLSIMLQFDTRDWCIRSHPGSTDSFSSITDMAGDPEWRQAGVRMLSDVLDFLDREYPERFYAVHLCAGGTCEWIQRNEPDNKSPLKQAAYRRWKKDNMAELCSGKEANAASHGLLRDPEQDAAALDFWQFHQEVVADTLCYFAAEAKRLRPNLLTGAFFGYFYYGPVFFLRRCHAAFSRVAACPHLDMLFSPASYSFRTLDGVSASQAPVDSAMVHGKLYYHEIDNTTYCANDNLFAQVLQSYAHKRHDTLEQSIHYMRREAALMMARRQALWWFDMFGNWFDDDRLIEEVARIDRAYRSLRELPAESAGEVAFITDGESVKYYRVNSQMHLDQVHLMRDAVGRMGTAVDCYESKDLLSPAFPSARYKLYIFANLIAPAPEIRAKIDMLRGGGACLLFLHAAGIAESGRLDPDGIGRLCGIEVEEYTGSSQYLAYQSDIFTPGPPDRCGIVGKSNSAAVFPCLRVKDRATLPIGYDLLDRTVVKTAVKPRPDGGFDAWAASGALPPAVLRQLAERAGVHIYTADGLPVYANSRMLAVFAHLPGCYRIALPAGVTKCTELYTGEKLSPVRGA